MRARPCFLALIIGFFLLACVSTEGKKALVAKRATFDLQCESTVKVTELGGDAFGAEACGKRASYVVHCRDPNNKATCTAIMNSDEQPRE